ncbi:uncharacterized protein LOC143030159 [Oratosquilla oratoria]|uniref:uncharacterized protein LOC143030159 n=1 Tax=Oratosquilla oratoria TaxID=337810 RepID=UPI003F75A646
MLQPSRPVAVILCWIAVAMATATSTLEFREFDFGRTFHPERTTEPPNVTVVENILLDPKTLGGDSLGVTQEGHADPRLLGIFTVVRFENSGCTGKNGDMGTCRTSKECFADCGTKIGDCAQGFGICCYKEITCGGSSSSNNTYLVSPNYPGTYRTARTCTMRITRMHDTCQLRMDFVEFESIAPSDTGVCSTDQLTVTGEMKFKYLCGIAPPNWHFYLDVNGQPDPTVFNFETGSSTFDRKFKIKISMIPCKQRVPCGCGQYFTENTGTIQSFNYGTGRFYLAGMNYGICLRKEKNRCTVTLDRAGPSFVACTDLYRQPLGATSQVGGLMALDVMNMYCQIPAANDFVAPFSQPAVSATTVNNGPINIWFQSTEDAVPNRDLINGNSGFHQTFTKNLC